MINKLLNNSIMKLLLDIDVLSRATDISDKTKTNYISSSKRLGKIDLNNVKNVKQKIKKLSSNPNIAGNYYSTILKFLQLINNVELRTTYKKILAVNIKKHDDSKKILHPDLVNVDYNKKTIDFINYLTTSKTITTNDFILSFYVLLPPRRSEYSNMIYTEQKIKNDTINYLQKNKNKYILHFNNFKNVKSIGKQKFTIDNKLLINLIKQQNLKEGERLYKKSRNTFTLDLKKITKQHYGIEMGINKIRILYNTNKFKNINPKELIEDANMMGHSVRAKINNYIRT